LAKWYVLRVTRNWVEDLPAESARALDHTQRALDISPDCSLALAMEGFVHCHMRRDLDAAERVLKQALEINPSNSLAWLFLSVVEGFRGAGSVAVESADHATRLSPLDPLRHYYDGLACSAALAASQLPKAIALAKRSLQGNRSHVPTLRVLAIAEAEAGSHIQARATAQKILTLEPGFNLGHYVAQSPPGAEANRQRYAKALGAAGIPWA
jgi:tetratricopeptide (TPR) repeat protein